MAEVKVSLQAELSAIVAEMREAAKTAERTGNDYDALNASIVKLTAQVDGLTKAKTKQVETDKKVTKGLDGVIDARKRAAKNEGEYTLTVNRTELAQRNLVNVTSDILKQAKLSEASQKTITRVTGSYSEILNELGDNQGYLLNQWKRSLPTADKTARALAELVAFSTDGEKQTEAYAIAVAQLAAKLESQEAKLAASGDANRRYGLSLQEIIQQQTKSLQGSLERGLALQKEGVSVDSLKAALKDLKRDTTSADKASTKYKETVRSLEQQVEDLTAAEKEQKQALESVADSYEQSKKKVDAYETALDSLGVPGASVLAKIRNLNDAFETAAEVGGEAEVSSLKNAIALGAVASAAAITAAGVAGAAGAIIAVTANSAEWNRELEDLGLNLDTSGTAAVNAAEAGFDVLGASLKGIGVEIGATFGPLVTEGTRQLTAMALAGREAFTVFTEGKSITFALSEVLAKGLVATVDAAISPIKNMAIAAGLLTDLLGITEDAAISVDKAFEEMSDTLVENTAVGLNALAHEGFVELTEVTGDYLARADELIGKQTAINLAARQSAESIGAAADATKELQEASRGDGEEDGDPIEAMLEQYTAFYDVRSELQTDLDAQLDASLNAELARIAKEMAAENELAALKKSAAQAGMSLAQESWKLAKTLLANSEKDQSRALEAMFYVEQGAAAASVIVSTSQAIMKAFATYGPPPSPAGIAAAAAAGLAGGASLASIAAATIQGGGGLPSISIASGGAGTGGGFTSAPSAASVSETGTVGATTTGGDVGGGQGGPTMKGADIPATDMTIKMGMRGRTIQGAEGDMLVRGGALGLSSMQDSRLLDVMVAMLAAIESNGARLDRMSDGMEMTNYRAGVISPRSYDQ